MLPTSPEILGVGQDCARRMDQRVPRMSGSIRLEALAMTELDRLIADAREKVARMTPEERAAMIQAQRESWVRGECGMDETTCAAPSPPAPDAPTAFDDLLAVNEHTSNKWHEMHRVLMMALQLAYSGNHDGTSENCPTCHVVKEARKIGIVFDAETGEPLG